MSDDPYAKGSPTQVPRISFTSTPATLQRELRKLCDGAKPKREKMFITFACLRFSGFHAFVFSHVGAGARGKRSENYAENNRLETCNLNETLKSELKRNVNIDI